MKVFFLTLFILGSLLGFNKYSDVSQFFETSVLQEVDNVENLVAPASYNEFTGTAVEMTLNNRTSAIFGNVSSKRYFSFTSTENQFIKLNYTGTAASLKVYNKYYFSDSDYLLYLDNVKTKQDIVYMDMNQTYIFEFQNNSVAFTNMSVIPEKLDTTFTNHEKYLMHLIYDENSAIGYHYEVEYFDVSLTEATSTNGNIIVNLSPTTYLDLIDYNNVHMGFNNDDRRLVSEPGYSYYSSISKIKTINSYLINGSFSSYIGHATGTFIDEKIVLSCAHNIYCINSDRTTISRSLKFYPGASSYPNNFNYYSNFGEYTAKQAFTPISYILSSNNEKKQYDWCIFLTENTVFGLYSHSYMGLYNFSSFGTEFSPSSSVIESAGYPGLQYTANEDLSCTMWTSYPLLNSVYNSSSSSNILESKEIVCSPGNSGGPWFTMNANIVNGTLYYYIGVVGVVSTHSYREVNNSNLNEFVSASSCRVRPIIINTYNEVKDYEI